MRLTLACAFGIGYVLGSRAGRQRYDQIRELAGDASRRLADSGVPDRLGDYGARLEEYASRRSRTTA
jgi:hypothetical protein